MERNTITTLAVRFWGTIETPPNNNREHFRQGVIDTILKVLKLRDVTIEYIGYRPDKAGLHHLNTSRTIYEDCVFVSLSMNMRSALSQDGKLAEDIVNDFITVFENKTHKHLEIDSEIVNDVKHHKLIEMTSDWKYYLKQG
ncbi:MAG TPA: hypothetical protein VF676_10640 [Flavobacterium sp.]